MLIKRTAPALVWQSWGEGSCRMHRAWRAQGAGFPTYFRGYVGRLAQILVAEGLWTNCTEALQALRWGTERILHHTCKTDPKHSDACECSQQRCPHRFEGVGFALPDNSSGGDSGLQRQQKPICNLIKHCGLVELTERVQGFSDLY